MRCAGRATKGEPALEVQGALMLRANDVVKRLGGSWMLQSEAQRQRVTTLPTVAFG